MNENRGNKYGPGRFTSVIPVVKLLTLLRRLNIFHSLHPLDIVEYANKHIKV